MVRKLLFTGMAVCALSSAAFAAEEAKKNELEKLFSPKVSENLHHNFLDFDRNRDTFITFAEFAFSYRNYYVVGDDPTPLSQHFAAMDLDDNGLVTEKEFTAGHNAAYDSENYTMRWVPNGHKEESHN
jgi:hypothetical protein